MTESETNCGGHFTFPTAYKTGILIQKFNIKAVKFPAENSSCMLRPAKVDLQLKVSGVHDIPCECGKVYAEQTDQTIETRCNKHDQHPCLYQLYQPEESTVTEHTNQATWTHLSKRQ